MHGVCEFDHPGPGAHSGSRIEDDGTSPVAKLMRATEELWLVRLSVDPALIIAFEPAHLARPHDPPRKIAYVVPRAMSRLWSRLALAFNRKAPEARVFPDDRTAMRWLTDL